MVGGTFKGQAVNSHVVLFRNSHGYTNTSYPVLSGGFLILRFFPLGFAIYTAATNVFVTLRQQNFFL